jgi:predicted CoA-substrate-specific enzyme activase
VGERYVLGLDLGSVSLDAAVVDAQGKLAWSWYRRVQGRPREALAALCQALHGGFLAPHGRTSLDGAQACGSGKALVAELLGVPTVNEIVAHGTAAARFAGGAASVMEIGGQDSKFILVDEHGPHDYAMNELCAAGTGAFLDVQAERLGITIEELSRLAEQATRVPAVAGRCSVFAKSDLIHLQQRGTPVDEIAAGLCFALARNFLATLVRGRTVVKPVIFQGGVALNDGVMRAFRELLGLAEAQLLRPRHPGLMGALGAAYLCDAATPPLDAQVVVKAAGLGGTGPVGLTVTGWSLDRENERQRAALEEYQVRNLGEGPLALGLDVGSVSTDVVLVQEDGRVAAHVYTFTAGRPLEAAQRALHFLGKHVDRERVVAVGVTGSGRRLVGTFTGADLVVDEITAQARGAHAAFPEADTVIEIGGQDAKLTLLDRDGMVRDFEMNRACSAGTGSFLQEQSARLGVDLKADFARLAQGASDGVTLTSRCTVFLESDLVHHVQQGAPVPGILRGVAEAVVDNYMDRVARSRRPGRKVVLQGGVAHNGAVVDAFRRRLPGTDVVVHPDPGLSGAMGVAVLAREHVRRAGGVTAFGGFALEAGLRPKPLSCRLCENRCEVNVFESGGQRYYFGDLCGRYAEQVHGDAPGKDHTEMREMMLRGLVRSAAGGEVMGLPEALSFREYFPFWFSFFGALGFKVVTSGPTTSTKLHAGLTRLPAETCLPTKLLFGHVAELAQAGVRRLFIPATDRMAGGGACPYVQHAAAMVSAVWPTLEVISTPILPEVSTREREHLVEELAGRLKLRPSDVDLAWTEALDSFRLSRRATAVDPGHDRPTAVLVGKPYNCADRFLNLALPSKLARAGFDVVFADQLGLDDNAPLPPSYQCITWGLSRRMIRAAAAIRDRDNLFAVVVGNFGCGPDSFALPVVETELGDKPFLVLEMDEHRADAGLDTRVEAFSHRARRWLEAERAQPSPRPVVVVPSGARAAAAGRSEYILPRFSDHAEAFAGALRAEGVQARVLPLPGPEAIQAAVEHTGGKQCQPFQALAGDLLLLARKGELPRNASYFFPVSSGSCPITQYVPTMVRYLDQLGRGDVEVVGSRTDAVLDRFGASFALNVGRGIIAVEYLLRYRYEQRPYELVKGSVEAAYQGALQDVVEGLEQNRLTEGLQAAVKRLRAVETGARTSRPVIGVAGDVYTRVNPVANGGLFELLEELGCEVWLSPTILDVAVARNDPIPGRLPRYREIWESTTYWAANLVKSASLWQVQRQFKGLLRNLEEPSDEDVEQAVDGLFSTSTADVLLLLNVARHVDFARKRVDGILNVFCLNCMVGTSTAAVYPALRERTGDTPMMSLVFDGLGTTHTRNRLEAFVHRVKRARSRRVAAETPAEV